MAPTVQALERAEHLKGLHGIEDTLVSAQAALTAGQTEIYKARLHSAYLTIGMMLKQEVV